MGIHLSLLRWKLSRMDISFDSQIVIEDIAIWMDGGTVILKCFNNERQNFSIEFTQSVLFEIYEFYNRLPGRLYLNEKIAEQRSELEEKIIKAIERVSFKKKELDNKIIFEKIKYIESQEYLDNVLKVTLKKR